MIEFTKSYKTADGKVHGTIEQAQLHELEAFLSKLKGVTSGPVTTEIANHILQNKDILIDVLTTTPNSKPKARASHGGTKTRKKTVVTDAETSITSNSNESMVSGQKIHNEHLLKEAIADAKVVRAERENP